MTRPKLSVVPVSAVTPPTYAEVGPEARKGLLELTARVSRVNASLSGAFATTVKVEEAMRQLADAEVLCRSTRNALRGGL